MTSVVQHDSLIREQTFDQPAERTVPIADPGAWAILAFSATSLMLGLYNGNFVNPAGAALVIPVAFFFGGAIQIIVAVLEVVRGNVFGAVVFGSFGPFWVIYGFIQTTFEEKVVEAATKANVDPTAAVSSGLTVFLAMFAVLTFVFLVSALRTDAVLVSVLVLLLAALVLLMIGVHSGIKGFVQASGYVTVVFAVLGLYRGTADIMTATYGRQVLPVFKLS
ncbi:acetate uptake transporter [Amycolatopsis sp. NPDC050768]|uniref:acetate uptake transporter n=1 Tax=Amycolatopsis sp. NPDC050768 TaxID=3154839 RepID=UPI0034102D90